MQQSIHKKLVITKNNFWFGGIFIPIDNAITGLRVWLLFWRAEASKSESDGDKEESWFGCINEIWSDCLYNEFII